VLDIELFSIKTTVFVMRTG